MEKQKLVVRIICAILVVLMGIGMLLPLSSLAHAASETPAQKLERIQKEINSINASIKANRNDATKAQQLSNFYKKKESAVRAQIAALQEDINQRKVDLTKKQEELALQIAKVEEAQNMLGQRLRAMYEMKRSNPISILFGLENLSDMLRFSENLRTITVSNDELIQKLKQEREVMQQQAQTIQQDLDALGVQEQQLSASQAELVKSIQQANKMVDEAKAQEQALQVVLEDKKKQEEAARIEWQQWVQSSNADKNYIEDNGEFFWPVPNYYRISSDFGTTRVINGVKDVHRGMDIPAPAGTPIYATAAGVVSTKAHWSYGTSVKISHTPSMVTVYGHMSARAAGIADGVVVQKGQLIGYVGSTGNSTGNHLHYELDINGSPTSIRPYLDPKIISKLHF